MSDFHFSKIASELGPDWETLSTRLGFKHTDIFRFKRCSDKVDTQICEMFQKWKQNQSRNVEKMKKELTEALTEMERFDLADLVLNYGSRKM